MVIYCPVQTHPPVPFEWQIMINFYLLWKTDKLICHFVNCKWEEFALIDSRSDNSRCEAGTLDQIRLLTNYNKTKLVFFKAWQEQPLLELIMWYCTGTVNYLTFLCVRFLFLVGVFFWVTHKLNYKRDVTVIPWSKTNSTEDCNENTWKIAGFSLETHSENGIKKIILNSMLGCTRDSCYE